jgi:hypothetical protein
VSYLLTATLGKESIDWFEVIAAGDIVPAKKPAPDIYQYAMDKMNLTAADCLAFEDSDNGVRSSLGANLKTLVTINAYTHAQDFSGASLVVDQFGEADQPFTVLEGNAVDASYVDLALLEQITPRHFLKHPQVIYRGLIKCLIYINAVLLVYSSFVLNDRVYLW